VREAIAADGRTTALGIDVTVTPGAVHLAGTVGSPEQRDELTTVAHEIVPDRPVRNDVAVVTGDPPTDDDVEELR
jgi:osmotically-inducible protein OsmY